MDAFGESEADGAWVRSEFGSVQFPELKGQFPSSFTIAVTHRLSEGELSLEAEGVNIGESDMPVGLGIHPYFRLPLHRSGQRERCSIHLPADLHWELDDCIPTGNQLPVSGKYDLRNPTDIADRFLQKICKFFSIIYSICQF